MANPLRGDVALIIDGQRYVARLTLGALAELEDTLDEPTLLSLVERFESNSFSSRDVLRLLVAMSNSIRMAVCFSGRICQATMMAGSSAGVLRFWTDLRQVCGA